MGKILFQHFLITAGIEVKLRYYSVVSNHSELLYSMYHQFDQDGELPKYSRQAGVQKIHINKKYILPMPFPNLLDAWTPYGETNYYLGDAWFLFVG